MKNSLFQTLVSTIAIAICGCGASKQAEDLPDQITGGTTSASAAQVEIFPEPKLPKIEFIATNRAQPKSSDEALAALESIKKLYGWENIPEALNRDLTLESAYQYVKAWKLLNEQIPFDVEWLKKLDSKSVPGVDKISVQTIENTRKQQLDWLENRLPDQMAKSAKYTRTFITDSLAPMMWQHIVKAADTDMSDQSAVRNLLGRQELNELRGKQIRSLDESFAAAILFDQVMNIESDWNAKRNDFRQVVQRYQQKLESAADAILPPKDIGDTSLAKIAADVLSDKTYKLAKPHRIIVNAKPRDYGKDHYSVDFGERTIEKSPYRWKEFQVATIEKEGDQYYLWYNTLLNYSEGPHTVPTDKWVLGPRHKSAPIAEANIDK